MHCPCTTIAGAAACCLLLASYYLPLAACYWLQAQQLKDVRVISLPGVVRYPPLCTTQLIYLLLATYYLLRAAYSLNTCYVLLTISLPGVVRYPLYLWDRAALLRTTCYILRAACCLLLTTCYVLLTRYATRRDRVAFLKYLPLAIHDVLPLLTRYATRRDRAARRQTCGT